ncbi:hypothetical protein MD535_22170 [Vibrio sp. ZSDZ65]|uniref:DUF1845 domain-containing protein n=1 Tax=Vibrio qingdaonensis TaxID=2829491 RepID=A0A9X3HYW1_9VIBR|nr:hypothetical protein [Vibrio qingdaonensis]MCW8348698.1 hypothetical protein [Vibrio qingdaonensis]
MLTLSNQTLHYLWDTPHSQTKPHSIDGKFTYDSVFSVLAFASNPRHKEVKKFAEATLQDIEESLMAYRQSIREAHQTLSGSCGDIDFTPVQFQQYALHFDEKKLNSAPAMLLKAFLETDALFADIEKALKSGEMMTHISKQEKSRHINQLKKLLNRLSYTAVQFHKFRKGG